jgi:hypothetical protein
MGANYSAGLESHNHSRITTDRLDHAMELLTFHIQRHVEERGSSPFLCIFERLEVEKAKLDREILVLQRVQAFLTHKATRSSQSSRVSKVGPAR